MVTRGLMRYFFLVVSISAILLQSVRADVNPDLILGYKIIDNDTLNVRIFNPPGLHPGEKRPAIVFFYGGGWNNAHPKQFYPHSEYLASRGLVAICADYRTKSTHNTSPIECVKDGKSAIRWVRRHAKELGIDPDKLVAGGGSAGAHVAAATATLSAFNEAGEDTTISARPNALVLFNPVLDTGPEGYGYSRVKNYWQDFSPAHHIDQHTPPCIILLGTNDHVVPVATAERFKTSMETAGGRCDLVCYDGLGHGFYLKEKYFETLTAVDRFLASFGYLRGEPTLKKDSIKSEYLTK